MSRIVAVALLAISGLTSSVWSQELPPPPDSWGPPSSTEELPPPTGPTQPAQPQFGEPFPEYEEFVEESPPWYTIEDWFDPEIWTASLEVGINGTEGNSQTLSFQSGGEFARKTDISNLSMDVTYARTQANSVETQNYGLFNARHDYTLGESRWSWFTALNLQYDEFQAFDLRLALNSGLGYSFIKNDITTFTGRFGAGTSREFGGPDERWVPEAVFGADYEHQLTKRQKFKATVDYFPEWSDFSNYRVTTTAGWEVLLDEETNLSLKLGVTDRYDSTPNGAKPNDFNYSLLLLWKS